MLKQNTAVLNWAGISFFYHFQVISCWSGLLTEECEVPIENQ
jgi:hypothetical protein